MDTNDSGTLSELESLSDSDWLDISSGASGDTDSIVGFDDSDHEDRPPSRRSNLSTDSLDEGHARGWEGLPREQADDSPMLEGRVLARTASPSSPFRSEPLSASNSRLIDAEDPEEEERVKAALDQSMMSTLNSSRSGSLSASLQTSFVQSRELRLAFPDPLTTSLPEYRNTSFEEIVSPPSADLPDMHAVVSAAGAETMGSLALVAADQGAFAMPEIPQDDVAMEPDAYIVLHGFSSMTKASVIETLLEKMAQNVDLTLSPERVFKSDGCLRFFVPHRAGNNGRCVSVLDFTELAAIGDDNYLSTLSLDRPSLAVVFLPTPATLRLTEHTLYLPVLAQDTDSVDKLIDAEQQWENLGLPRSKVAMLSRGSTVIDQDDLERVKPMQLTRVMRHLFNPARQTESKRAKGFGSSPAFTIFAVLSIVLGYVIQGSVSPSHAATPTVAASVTDSIPPLWGLLRPVTAPLTNHSTPTVATSSSVAVVPSTLKELALAVLNPAQLSATTSLGTRQAPSTPTPLADDGPSECSCGCGLITWPGIGKGKGNTDIAVRSTPGSLAIASNKDAKAPLSIVSSQEHGKGKGKAVAVKDDTLYALSTRIAGSLSEYIEWNFGAATASVRRDMQELVEALDKLVLAIRRQTVLAWEQSRGTAQGLQTHIRERHRRAKRNAKRLRALGERLLSSVGEHIQERHGHASVGAKKLKDMGGQLLSTLGGQVRERVDVAKGNARALREGRMAKKAKVLRADRRGGERR